ncbi:MAG: succinate dehydrogenase, hydrophobic membrane anchor protein [Paracoccaceae bacterium]|uniref:succinate dehydrogenase, hydrophobic membrane anchor protein n=1 Tax=Seohaeicola saemankumensis TaxID=481181 RepID=UPI001E4252D9|nr:succinate dehydrogenase, hydrophobic membrane anchor protein [Seohaeicola saemankumensis]MCD1626151.1 succinate dehydrogenase, hydrophobic membrane anchor protein [Seohaeicola saemankumensis]
MRYLTDRKRASGMGSAKSGTAHFWSMKVSSVALLVLIPLFVFSFGPMLGASHADVLATFARPFPAIIAALTLIVGFKHFNDGAQTMIEDYVHGTTQKIVIIAVTCLSYGAAATGLFAIAKIAL